MILLTKGKLIINILFLNYIKYNRIPNLQTISQHKNNLIYFQYKAINQRQVDIEQRDGKQKAQFFGIFYGQCELLFKLQSIVQISDFMSNQHEIKYMLASLKVMQDKLGGPSAKRNLAGTEFDYIQDQFLAKRHQIQKWQDQKQREGLTTKNADIAYKIREGVKELKQLLNKLQKQYERLAKKKKETPDILQNKRKIVTNCEMLYKDIEDRLYGQANPNNYNKPMTLTDMKAKLLNEIQMANYNIHSKSGSQDKLSEINEEEIQAMEAYKKKDEEMDIVLDEIIQVVGGVTKKVKGINEKQDEVNKKVEAGNKKAIQLERRIKTDNEKLKVIIEKFKPGRCCLAIFLLLLFIGLIVVIIKFLVPAP